MGVRGLSSFVESHSKLSRPYKLHDCGVIVDGNNLVHFLYKAHGLDVLLGGELYEFAEIIRSHFSAYLECNVKPIVFFDGGSDSSDRKLENHIKKHKENLYQIQCVAKDNIFPPDFDNLPKLAKKVTVNVLESLNITCIQSLFEADEEIAELANFWNYPVISRDSDFYIFNIKPGFIRCDLIDQIDSDASNMINIDLKDRFKYLKCQIYKIDYFTSFFNVKKGMLPLFSTMMGNDYSAGFSFNDFFYSIFPQSETIVPRMHDKMRILLSWLKNRHINDAKEDILNHLKSEDRHRARNIINLSCNQYKLKSNSINIANIDQDYLLADVKNVKTFHKKSLPLRFMQNNKDDRIFKGLLNVLCLRRKFLTPSVEDAFFDSSYECSRYIRQIIYGLVLSHEKDVSNFHNFVEEYTNHQGGDFIIDKVYAIFKLNGYGPLPSLDDIPSIDIKSRQTIVSIVIGDTSEYFKDIPEKFQLLFGIIRYWLRHCRPNPTILNSLLLTIIFFTYAVPSIEKLHEKKQLKDDSEFYYLIKAITPKEMNMFYNNMKKYLHSVHFSGHPFKVKVVYYFSQFINCAKDVWNLNTFLLKPFSEFQVSQIFNGPFSYNLCVDLMEQSAPDLFIAQCLGKGSTLLNVYLKLKNLIMKDWPQDGMSGEISPPIFLKFSETTSKKVKFYKSKSNNSKISAIYDFETNDSTSYSSTSDDLEANYSTSFQRFFKLEKRRKRCLYDFVLEQFPVKYNFKNSFHF